MVLRGLPYHLSYAFARNSAHEQAARAAVVEASIRETYEAKSSSHPPPGSNPKRALSPSRNLSHSSSHSPPTSAARVNQIQPPSVSPPRTSANKMVTDTTQDLSDGIQQMCEFDDALPDDQDVSLNASDAFFDAHPALDDAQPKSSDDRTHSPPTRGGVDEVKGSA